ncbi:MAG: diguanylate cyclase [Bacillota bacterium]
MTGYSSEKRRILIVDDDPVSIQMLLMLLRDEYAVRSATDGPAALEIAMSDTPPDLILLDVSMPGMSGYEVCRTLKEDVRTRKIPVIFITGKDSESDEISGFEAGAVDYVNKPIHPVLVKARIRLHLELKQQRDLLESMATQDGLTGIANRRKFDEYFVVAAAYTSRNAFPLSLIMIDIDHFKLYNDHYGHFEGDICLIKVARAIAVDVKRSNDLAARYGGEEFACILPNAPHSNALAIAERIRASVLALKIPHELSPVDEFVTISLGVATVATFDSNVPEQLIVAADRALYSAKDRGRNRVMGVEL